MKKFDARRFSALFETGVYTDEAYKEVDTHYQKQMMLSKDLIMGMFYWVFPTVVLFCLIGYVVACHNESIAIERNEYAACINGNEGICRLILSKRLGDAESLSSYPKLKRIQREADDIRRAYKNKTGNDLVE